MYIWSYFWFDGRADKSLLVEHKMLVGGLGSAVVGIPEGAFLDQLFKFCAGSAVSRAA